MSDTTYIVLRRDGPGWLPQGSQEAGSPAAAIRRAVADTVNPGDEYVAVPARSWKPVTVRTETKTVLHLGAPDTAG
jgi:hypothetical protein